MRNERFEVSVTFDAERGYVASAPELREPIVALSLASLRKRIEIALLSDDVALQLDGLAERERHRRRSQAQLARKAGLMPSGPLKSQKCPHFRYCAVSNLRTSYFDV